MRKLSAILSADVAGYVRLMGEDAVAAVRTIESHRKTVASLVKSHDGRVVGSSGDNFLCEFASVVDAVQCAVGIQQEIGAKNADLPDNRRMDFRVGINLDDVIVVGDRIYGVGINIAVLIKALAGPGEICISEGAYSQMDNQVAPGYQDLGNHTLRNISRPVRVYRIVMERE